MAYNKTKTDPDLGQSVHQHRVNMGVESPVIDTGIERKDKIDRIEGNLADSIEILGLELADDSLM